MNFATRQHTQYCGNDLQAQAMYVCLLDQAGPLLVHQNLPTTRDAFLRIIAPSRDDVVGGVEGRFPWSWLADLWAKEGLAFVLGPALSMKARHGGKAKNDKIEAPTSAVLLRGGRLPQADVSPSEMRATRDVLRRRCSLVRKRAERVAHLQNTNRHYPLPEMGTKRADKANREGVEEHFPAPSVRKTRDVEVWLSDHSDQLLGAVELSLTRSAQAQEVQTFSR